MSAKKCALLLPTLCLGLLLASCDGTTPTLVSEANLPTIEMVDPNGPTPEPVIPTGGTFEDPVVSISSRCISYGIYTFDVRYSPTDLPIIEAGPPTYSERATCSMFTDGYFQCTGVLNPRMTGTPEFMFILDNGTEVRTVREFPFILAGCPAFVPSSQLVSVTCLPDNQVSFVIDPGTQLYNWRAVCLGNERCSGDGAVYYEEAHEYDRAHPFYESWIGDAPGSDSPPLRYFLRILGQNPDTDNYVTVFDDFYSRYLESCRTTIVNPRPTATDSVPVVQPPSQTCESYLSYDDCKAGGCSWWNSDYSCHAEAEPVPACSDYNGDPAKCSSVGCSYWTNGTCSAGQDPCSIYFEETACTKNSCSWDGVKTCFTK